MIFGYLISVAAACIAGGLIWICGTFTAPLWAQVMLGGAIVPIFLASAFLWIGGMVSVWKEFLKQEAGNE